MTHKTTCENPSILKNCFEKVFNNLIVSNSLQDVEEIMHLDKINASQFMFIVTLNMKTSFQAKEPEISYDAYKEHLFDVCKEINDVTL